MDAGLFACHSKLYEGANVTAVIQYDGIPSGGMADWEDQVIRKCFFVPGLHLPGDVPPEDVGKPLCRSASLDPVVISEVLGTLGALAPKGI